MKAIETPFTDKRFSYLFYVASEAGTRKPTPCQVKILEQMDGDAWYAVENTDRHESARSLVGKGWLRMARMADRDKKGNIIELEPEAMLMRMIFGEPMPTNVEMYQRVPVTPAPREGI
jgi:hypothetical protein